MIQEQTERLSHLSEVLLDMTGIQSIERSDSISLAALTDEVFCDLISVADQKEVELIQKDRVTVPLSEAICFSTGLCIILWKMPSNTIIPVEK